MIFSGYLTIDLVDDQFRVAEDCIKRRTQLVAHIGEKLRLVVARDLELMKQPRVLHRQRRLAGKGGHQIDHLSRKLAGLSAGDSQGAHHLVLSDQRHRQHGPQPALHDEVTQATLIRALDTNVRNLNWLTLHDRLAGHAFSSPERITQHGIVDLLDVAERRPGA